MRRFGLGAKTTTPGGCRFENRFNLARVRAGLLEVGQNRGALFENRRCRGGDTALNFRRRNPPAGFGRIRAAGYQATGDVIAIAALALDRVARRKAGAGFIEKLVRERALSTCRPPREPVVREP